MTRILLFEPMHEAGTRLLREQGEVVLAPALDEATLLSAVAEVDAIVIRNGGAVTRRLMEAAPRLKVIGRHGSGLDTIDLAAAAERGIRVVYTPEANCQSVAEHFVAMALVLSKRLLEADRALREGRWEVRHEYYGRELSGKTLGVVGFGRVGRATARICHHGFQMPVLYHSRSAAGPEAEAQCGARRAGLEQLLRAADFVSLNLPLTHPGLQLLQRLRDEAHRFANTYNADLRSKKIRESVLDDLPGLGETRRRALLGHFGGIDRLRAAKLEEIAEVPGFGPKLAAELHAFLRRT